jgi:hypothetical protein
LNSRQTTIIVLAAIFLAVIAVGLMQSIAFHIAGGCYTSASREFPSPERSHLIVISQTGCRDKESTTSIFLQDPNSPNTYLELLKVPSKFERGQTTIYPVTFGIEWRREDRVKISYPSGLSAYAGEELVPIDMLNLSRLDMYGIRIDLEPNVL